MNQRWLRQRLAEIPFIVFGTSLLLFLIFYFVGGDSAQSLAGKYATTSSIDEIKKQLGTNLPFYSQYFNFLKEILTFDFGNSWATERPVNSTILNAMGPTLLLTIPAFLLSFTLSTLSSLLMSLNHKKFVDRALSFLCFCIVSLSFLVLVILSQYFLSFKLGWFPVSGWSRYATDWPKYLTLPICIYAFASFGRNALLFRSLFLEELRKNHILYSRSKGVTQSILLTNHVLKNCWPSLVAILSSQIPSLFVGSLILESFFGIPGAGNLIVDAFNDGDLPMLKGLTVTGCFIYILTTLFADSQLLKNQWTEKTL